MTSVKVGHACKVHYGGGAAGIVVGTIEDGVAVHAKVLIVSGENNHGVDLAGNVAADVLRLVAGTDYRWLGTRLREAEVLVVVLAEWFDSVGHHLGTEVMGSDGVSPMLHASTEHLLAAQVAYDSPRVGAVLGLQCR